jgi:hypothetical protein
VPSPWKLPYARPAPTGWRWWAGLVSDVLTAALSLAMLVGFVFVAVLLVLAPVRSLMGW